jgi:hypothetical protein
MELMLLIIPEKNVSKKHITAAKIIAIAVMIALFALVIWGISLIVDKNNLYGIIPILIAVIVSLVQIVAGIMLYKKHH